MLQVPRDKELQEPQKLSKGVDLRQGHQSEAGGLAASLINAKQGK